MSDDALERQKWADEFGLRTREIVVREGELDLKKRELTRTRWPAAVVIAFFTAVVAAGGNAWVAFWNGNQQISLEEAQAESVRILEMIKTGDREVAAQNLQFLLDAGLVANNDRKSRIAGYLQNRKVGEGPVLEPASSNTARPSGYRQKFNVFVQFAGGAISREDVRAMMINLEGKGWAMQGTEGGGQLIPTAAGQNVVKFGAGGAEAAKLLADEMRAISPGAKPAEPLEDPQIRPGQLEIWISN